MRIWFKIYADAHLKKSETIETNMDDTRTHKIFWALEQACVKLDLAKPIWLDSNITEFKRQSRTRFYRDSFVEEIEFDYLEMQVLEED